MQKVAGSNPRWSQPATCKFSVYSVVNGTFFEAGKVTVAKVGGWALFFTCCAQEKEVFLTPIDPTITRPQEIFIFYDSLHDLATTEYGK